MSLKKEIKYLLLGVVVLIIGVMVVKIMIPLKTDINNELNLTIDGYTNIENKTNGKRLKDFSIINEKKDTLLLSSLLYHSKLIYRFSELHCDSCIIHEFENLRKQILAMGLDTNDVIILCHYQNPRNLSIFKRINKLQDFEIYNLLNNNLGELEIDNVGYPYFFILNSKFKISNTFIPIKVANQRTDDYLKRISTLLK